MSCCRYIAFSLLLLVSLLSAADTPPSWLDTLPPRVTIEPSGRWHRALFLVRLNADESSQLWISRGDPKKLQKYHRPISVTRDGVYRYYFCGEDDFGNRSAVDSIEYVLDTRAPDVSAAPAPGVYKPHTLLRISRERGSSLYFVKSRSDSLLHRTEDSLWLDAPLHGFFVAVDSAGNRTYTDSLAYAIDTAGFSIAVDLPEGIYNTKKTVTISTPSGMKAFYTFDPLAPPEWFTEYKEPFRLPHGLTIMRYFGKSASGAVSDIRQRSYIIDTIPPHLQKIVSKGEAADTLRFYTKEASEIIFTTDGSMPNASSRKYSIPLVILHEGISRIKARAIDKAGNISEVVTWEYKYDYRPPEISADPPGGHYTHPVTIELRADEPARFVFSYDTTDTALPFVYYPGAISFTRQGRSVLRYRGIDAADNPSAVKTEIWIIDSKPPDIDAVIQSDIAANRYVVTLQAHERNVAIHYAVNGSAATTHSELYTAPLTLQSGDVLTYLGIDSVGNVSPVKKLDELEQPMVEAKPAAGVYNRRLKMRFDVSGRGNVWWRILPDTLFRQATDSLVLDREGEYGFEYFLLTENGLRSAIRRNVYVLDWTSPEVSLRVQKGTGDSAIIFFDVSENASIYYTTDGTNPLFSPTTRTAGNRFQRSYDRISLKRDPDTRLAYYAEDAAGNQSALTILDVFRPHVIPSVPAGADRIHDRILSVTLQSQEGTIIHYLRHGKIPNLQSPVFSEPINLSSSDTIVAFVVDGTGYQGEPETFVYRIDLPPSPQFSVVPESLYAEMPALFSARGTIDRESAFEKLRFRWDFDGDGKWDTDTAFLPEVKHAFKSAGVYNPVLEVTDERLRKATFKREVMIRERCPGGMVASFDGSGRAFCIDKYEWPNREGAVPATNVSWVEAKMACLDAGKRLCSEDEWKSACNNKSLSMYPYGDHYDAGRCATESRSTAPSGSHPDCSSAGVDDMIGNVWEWVEEKRNDLTQALGGSYKYGKDAYCGLRFEGTVASKSEETGFRCCK